MSSLRPFVRRLLIRRSIRPSTLSARQFTSSIRWPPTPSYIPSYSSTPFSSPPISFRSRLFSSSSSPSSSDFTLWNELNNRGLSLYHAGKLAEARLELKAAFDEAVRQSMKIRPEAVAPYPGLTVANMANVQHALGDAEKAEINFKSAISALAPFDLWTLRPEERVNLPNHLNVEVPPAVLGRIHRNYGILLEETHKWSEALRECLSANILFQAATNEVQRKAMESVAVVSEKDIEAIKVCQREQCSALFGVAFLHEQLSLNTTDVELRSQHQEGAHHHYKLAEELTAIAFGPMSLNMAHLLAQWGNFLVRHWKSGPANSSVLYGERSLTDRKGIGRENLERAFQIYKYHDPKHPSMKAVLEVYLASQLEEGKVKEAVDAILADVEKENERK